MCRNKPVARHALTFAAGALVWALSGAVAPDLAVANDLDRTLRGPEGRNGTERRRPRDRGVAFEPRFSMDAPSLRPRFEQPRYPSARSGGGAERSSDVGRNDATRRAVARPEASRPAEAHPATRARRVLRAAPVSGGSRAPAGTGPAASARLPGAPVDLRPTARPDAATARPRAPTARAPTARAPGVPLPVPRPIPTIPAALAAATPTADPPADGALVVDGAPSPQQTASVDPGAPVASTAGVPTARAPVTVRPVSGGAAGGSAARLPAGDGVEGQLTATVEGEVSEPARDARIAGAGHAADAGSTADDDAVATADRDAGVDTEANGAAQAVTEADPASEPAIDLTPSNLSRVLSALQDEMARGSVRAVQAQRALIARLGDALRAVPDSTWEVPRNQRALVHLAMSGLSPRHVRALADRLTLLPAYDPLLRGALAFGEGRADDARQHLADLDVEAVDVDLKGPLALMLATLWNQKEPAKALAYLDVARFAAPATLVEEAALRRAVLIASNTGDIDRFARLVSRYLRRFRRSIYAGNFRKRLKAAVTRMAFVTDADTFPTLQTMLEPMTDAGQREVYLWLARAALEKGSEAVAEVAAQTTMVSAPEDTLDRRRARLYLAASQVVDPAAVDAALTVLRSLDPATLPDVDVALLDAALSLADAVARLPEAEIVDGTDRALLGALATPPATAEGAADGAAIMTAETRQRVVALLTSVDQLLERLP